MTCKHLYILRIAVHYARSCGSLVVGDGGGWVCAGETRAGDNESRAC